jgi:MFS transporter, FHS family, glucose/mannose:H+ symporter
MSDARVGSGNSSGKNRAFEWRLVHAGFVATGVVTTLLGPTLPMLAAHWSLNDKQAGFFFTAQFIGSMLGVMSTSYFLPRRGYTFVLAAGFGLMAVGVGTLGLGTWTIGCVSVFASGIGLGLTIPASNLFVSSHAGTRSVAALSILNFAWSLGAVFCPLLVVLVERKAGLRGLALLIGGVTVLFAMTFAIIPGARIHAEGRSARRPMAVWVSLLRRPELAWLAVFFFLYVGTENALGGWVASHAKRAGTGFDSFWVLTPSVFWGCILLGRGLAPVAWRYLGSDKLARLALGMAGLGGLLILVSVLPMVITVAAGLVGLGLAPMYPILVAWLSEALGTDVEWASGLMFGAAGLGGAVLPWLVGATSTAAGSLRVGLGVPLLSCVMMLCMATRRGSMQTAKPAAGNEFLASAGHGPGA